MGGLLTRRFIGALLSSRRLNRTLEARVADREQEDRGELRRIALLQREQAAAGERQRIMHDLHDGLGSQLFISLLRAERGATRCRSESPSRCASGIARCALALDALAPTSRTFAPPWATSAFAGSSASTCGHRLAWDIEVPDEVLQLPPHDRCNCCGSPRRR